MKVIPPPGWIAPNSAELLEFKHRLLGHLEAVRLNQFFLEQVATTEKQTIDRVELPSLLWNVSMASNLIQAVKEATSMLCSPIILSDNSEKPYLHTMDAIHSKEVDG
ncbi:hypothetical protein BGZ96_010089 [Linnemannia gamsii]|uniref:Uncharacterized protein n=1 Tax=Linnemannia gamsii TaxID=64522 RepID=A0ABQ7JUX7_9FUNG|nr:hypothetical protein BGZ96_010089 [Linnemannia gamsii]